MNLDLILLEKHGKISDGLIHCQIKTIVRSYPLLSMDSLLFQISNTSSFQGSHKRNVILRSQDAFLWEGFKIPESDISDRNPSLLVS